MKYIVTINDKNYEVEVEQGKATIIKTTPAAAPAPQPVAAPAAAPLLRLRSPTLPRLLHLPMYLEKLLKLLCRELY